jgi:hypothetical protein
MSDLEPPKIVDTLDELKARLEIEKLKAEVRNAQLWWRPSLIQATPTILAVLVTWYVASSTGLLDAKREHQQAQSERLQIQTIKLEQQEKIKQEQLAEVQNKLILAQGELDGFQSDKTAIQKIRKLLRFSIIEYLSDGDGFRIQIEAPIDHWVMAEKREVGTIRAKVAPDDRSAIFKALSTIRNVKELSIKYIDLTPGDLKQIGMLSDLRVLTLHSNNIDNDTMASFPIIKSLTDLEIVDNKFSESYQLSECNRLRSVFIMDTPVSNRAVQFLGNSAKELMQVGLKSISINDEVIPILLKCPKLSIVGLYNTGVTKNGVLSLASQPNISYISVSEGPNITTNDFPLEDSKKTKVVVSSSQ